MPKPLDLARTGVCDKLRDKTAIQGTINSAWTLHKSDLLELQADEVTVYVGEILGNDLTKEATLSTVNKNKEKMIDLIDSLRIVHAKEGEKRGEEITELMRDLRKCQSALKKSIDHKYEEMRTIPFTAHDPEMSPNEVEIMVEEIANETYFEPADTEAKPGDV